MGVAETTILVTKADAVILVVDARKFTIENLEQGLAHLRSSGANVVGIVLNRVRWRKMAAIYGYGAPAQALPPDSLRARPRRIPR
jgi:Mrp family chromosome partitioning ATPase